MTTVLAWPVVVYPGERVVAMRALLERARLWSVGDWMAVVMAIAAVAGVGITALGLRNSPGPNGIVEETPPVSEVPPTEEEPPAVKIRHIENAPDQKPDCDWEFVELINESDQAQNISYWTIEDEGSHYKFTFPEYELAAGAMVKVWTSGEHTAENDLVWGSSSVWNNDGDKATLRDREGNEIHVLACGR